MGEYRTILRASGASFSDILQRHCSPAAFRQREHCLLQRGAYHLASAEVFRQVGLPEPSVPYIPIGTAAVGHFIYHRIALCRREEELLRPILWRLRQAPPHRFGSLGSVGSHPLYPRLARGVLPEMDARPVAAAANQQRFMQQLRLRHIGQHAPGQPKRPSVQHQLLRTGSRPILIAYSRIVIIIHVAVPESHLLEPVFIQAGAPQERIVPRYEAVRPNEVSAPGSPAARSAAAADVGQGGLPGIRQYPLRQFQGAHGRIFKGDLQLILYLRGDSQAGRLSVFQRHRDCPERLVAGFVKIEPHIGKAVP